MALPVVKSLETLATLPITFKPAEQVVYIFIFYFLRGAQILTCQCKMQSEPVLRPISVDGTFRCVHFSIDNCYHLSRNMLKETRSLRGNYCLCVKHEPTRVHFDYAVYFSVLHIFLFSYYSPLSVVVLMTSSMTVKQIMTPYPT